MVFDREAYSPVFFQTLWQEHRIAVITYRKYVKDSWDENDFSPCSLDIEGNQTTMELVENPSS